MTNPIRIKRGPDATLPTGSEGEPLYTTDTQRFLIGNGVSNQEYQKILTFGIANTNAVLVDGAGISGQVAQWTANGLTAANLIAPASLLTLVAGGAYTLTIPATGTAALGTGAANYVGYWSDANTLTGAATFQYQTAATDNLLVQAANAAHVAAVFKGAASQTDNILEIQDSTGAVISGFESRGVIFSDLGQSESFFAGLSTGNVTNTTAARNIAIGYLALNSATYAVDNVAIGRNALGGSGNSASYNTAIGSEVLKSITSGSYNFGLGGNALTALTTGERNVGVGYLAGGRIQTGGNNIFIGYQAGYGAAANQTSVDNNIAIGYLAGYSLTTNKDSNIFIGSEAGRNSAGDKNLMIGYRSGFSVTSGRENIFFGYGAGWRQTTNSNLFIVDYVIRGSVTDEAENSYLYGSFANNGYLQINIPTTTTNAVINTLKLQSYVSTASTGGSAGFGTGLSLFAETATDGTYQQQALVASSWVDATNATRKAKLALSAYDTAVRLGLEIEASGSAAKLTTYGPTYLFTGTTALAPIYFNTGGSLLSSPVAGALEFANNRLYITNVATQRAIDRTSDVITSTTTVSDTVTETTIYTGTLGANDWKAGNINKVKAHGVISNATAADDITINVYIGSTLVETFNPAIGNVTSAPWDVEFDLIVRTVGATGSVAFHGKVTIDTSTQEDNSIETIDTTSANNMTIKVQWDNAKAGNTISIYQGYLEYKN